MDGMISQLCQSDLFYENVYRGNGEGDGDPSTKTCIGDSDTYYRIFVPKDINASIMSVGDSEQVTSTTHLDYYLGLRV